jgi:hypothetical protein
MTQSIHVLDNNYDCLFQSMVAGNWFGGKCHLSFQSYINTETQKKCSCATVMKTKINDGMMQDIFEAVTVSSTSKDRRFFFDLFCLFLFLSFFFFNLF